MEAIRVQFNSAKTVTALCTIKNQESSKNSDGRDYSRLPGSYKMKRNTQKRFTKPLLHTVMQGMTFLASS